MTPSQQRIKSILACGQSVSMVQTYRSRTLSVRGYKLFAVTDTQRVIDITSDVCRCIGTRWNDTRGTYETSEPSFYSDSQLLSDKLSAHLGFVVTVSTL